MVKGQIEFYPDRAAVERAGFRPYIPNEPIALGDPVILFARGGWRLGLVEKVTKRYVYAKVATPTSPDLWSQGRGNRDGRFANLYVKR